MKFLLCLLRSIINPNLFFLFLWVGLFPSFALAEGKPIEGDNNSGTPMKTNDLEIVAIPRENDDLARTIILIITKPDGSRQFNQVQEWKTVIVTKSDGSRQCYQDSGISPDEMAEEQLADIEILLSSKQHDGLIRTNGSCGEETGWLNVYEINIEDLEEARKRGFGPWPSSYHTAKAYGSEGEPFITTGDPFIPEGEPLITTDEPFISKGEPFIITTGDPFISKGEPLITTDEPFISEEKPFSLIPNCTPVISPESVRLRCFAQFSTPVISPRIPIRNW